MSKTGYKSIAVAGAGNVGQIIIEELIKLKNEGLIEEVVQLSRSAGGHKQTKEWGVRLVVVDYTDYSGLVEALKGIDAVVSAINGDAFKLQSQFAQAAKEAGVKLFAPSEFGNPTIGATDGVFALKDSVRLKLKEINLPYAIFYTGPFSDFIFNPHLGFDFKGRAVTIGGTGNAPVSFTSRRDAARFIAYALTSLPRDQVEWKIFRIEGDRIPLNDVIRGYETHTGKQINVTHIPREELEVKKRENPNDFVNHLRLEWDLGHGVTGEPEELDNKLWPEWKPTGVVDTLLTTQPVL